MRWHLRGMHIVVRINCENRKVRLKFEERVRRERGKEKADEVSDGHVRGEAPLFG